MRERGMERVEGEITDEIEAVRRKASVLERRDTCCGTSMI